MTAVGDLIADRYRVERHLGQGAMGQVWLAQDELLHRPVALKQLLIDPTSVEAADVDRAVREARLASRLNHPNAVAVHDLLMNDGRPVLVMEYVDGKTLAQVIRDEGLLSPSRAAELLGQVASALAAAHALDIVHRDVKPGNVLLTSDGRAKLADFGIARSGADATLTSTGMMIGTIAFMAPEVADGTPASKASDIWSLGATIFTTVEGQPPYRGRTPVEVLLKLVRDPLPETARAGRLESLIRDCMSRSVEERPDAADCVERLHVAAKTEMSATTITGSPADALPAEEADVATILRAPQPVELTMIGQMGQDPVDHHVATKATRASRRRVPVGALALLVGGLILLAVVFWPESTGRDDDRDAAGASEALPTDSSPSDLVKPVEQPRGVASSEYRAVTFDITPIPAEGEDASVQVRMAGAWTDVRNGHMSVTTPVGGAEVCRDFRALPVTGEESLASETVTFCGTSRPREVLTTYDVWNNTKLYDKFLALGVTCTRPEIESSEEPCNLIPVALEGFRSNARVPIEILERNAFQGGSDCTYAQCDTVVARTDKSGRSYTFLSFAGCGGDALLRIDGERINIETSC